MDKGLIDFGLFFGEIDTAKYEYIRLPYKDIWGILMRRDSPLAEKETISPEDLWDKPLIISRQAFHSLELQQFLQCETDKLNIVGTYNLLFNGSLMVDSGMGYAMFRETAACASNHFLRNWKQKCTLHGKSIKYSQKQRRNFCKNCRRHFKCRFKIIGFWSRSMCQKPFTSFISPCPKWYHNLRFTP